MAKTQTADQQGDGTTMIVESAVIKELSEKAEHAERILASERQSHASELTRLNEIIEQLRSQVAGTASQYTDETEKALASIMARMHAVAMGGAATELRAEVPRAVQHLGTEARAKVHEAITRMRSAAEAVEQEIVGIRAVSA